MIVGSVVMSKAMADRLFGACPPPASLGSVAFHITRADACREGFIVVGTGIDTRLWPVDPLLMQERGRP